MTSGKTARTVTARSHLPAVRLFPGAGLIGWLVDRYPARAGSEEPNVPANTAVRNVVRSAVCSRAGRLAGPVNGNVRARGKAQGRISP